MGKTLIAMLIFVGAPLWANADLKAFIGVWESQATTASGDLLLRLNFRMQDDNLKVTFDSPDEGLLGRSMQYRSQDDRISLYSVAEQTRFVGHLKGNYLVGRFYFRSQVLELSFERVSDELPSLPQLLGARVDSSPFGKAFLGSWSGLVIPQSKSGQLRVDIRIGQKEGHMTFSLDSPSQIAFDLQGRVTSLVERQIKIKIPVARAVYEGELSQDGQTIEGHWLQLGTRQKLDFKPMRTESMPFQTPKPPLPYEERSVVFKNQKDDVALYGSLTIPTGKGPFPAILITPGIFQADRDGTYKRHKTHWVLADALTRQGFAVLRFDRRGVGLSDGSDLGATIPYLIDDSLVAWHFLKNQSMIDSKRIGILGHSSGGRIAIGMHQDIDDLAFMVLLNTSVLNGRDTFINQMLGQTKKDAETEQPIELWQAIADTLRTDKSNRLLYQQIAAHFQTLAPHVNKVESQYTSRMLLMAPIRSFVRFDPQDSFATKGTPLLAIFSGNDPVVPAARNEQWLKKRFKGGAKAKQTVLVLPEINHYLQDSKTMAFESLDHNEQTISPRLLKALNQWLTKSVGL